MQDTLKFINYHDKSSSYHVASPLKLEKRLETTNKGFAKLDPQWALIGK